MTKYIPSIIGSAINFISLFSTSIAVNTAIKIFSKPRKGKINSKEKEYLKTATSKTVYHKNIALKTYHWKGSKSCVLLAHGWESNSYRWKPLIKILKQQNHAIITVDAPAHGDSGSKTFNAILYSECLSEVIKTFKPETVIGHSVGGTALAIALNKNNIPELKKLILIGAPSNFISMVNNYKSMMGFNKIVNDGMDQYYLHNFGHLPDHFTVANFSEHIKAKGLVFHDKKDKIIPFTDALDIIKHYKNSKLIKTTGLGHGMKSEQVYSRILQFLND